MVKCPICNKETVNNKGMSYHFTISHKQDYIKYLADNHLIQIPKCLECNKEIDVTLSSKRMVILNNPLELKYCNNECKNKNELFKKSCSDAGKIGIKTLKKYYEDNGYTEEHKNKISIKTKENWKDNEIRDKRIEGIKNYTFTKEHRANISKGSKGKPKSQSHIDNLRKATVNGYLNGNFYGNKYTYYSTKNEKSLNLKSSYELKLAILLDASTIIKLYNYEKISLYSKELNKAYIPDFYYIKNGISYLVEIDRYKGFKEKTGYGWKLKLADD